MTQSTENSQNPRFLQRLKQFLLTVFLFVLGVVLLLSIVTHHDKDAAFFSYNSNDTLQEYHNILGVLGASISDFLMFFFGYSALWFGVLVLVLAFRYGYSKVKQQQNTLLEYPWLTVVLWFLLLSASSCLESARLYHYNLVVPKENGGVWGSYLQQMLAPIMGVELLSFVCILIVTFFTAWFLGFSWLNVAEKVGIFAENIFLKLVKMTRLLLQSHKVKKEQHKLEDDLLKTRNVPPPVIKEKKVKIKASPRFKKEQKREEKNQNLLLPETSKLPPLTLLEKPSAQVKPLSEEELLHISNLIELKLKEFGVIVHVRSVLTGPVITSYHIELNTGVRGSQVVNLEKDLARVLMVASVRVVETVKGKNFMALEIPNAQRQSISLSNILSSNFYSKNSSPLALTLGQNTVGEPVVADLTKMPHLLVAGTTGSGKSVAINAMLMSILFKATPEEVRLILIDPKILEFSSYNGIAHLLCPVISDAELATRALGWAVREMDKRYQLISDFGVKTMSSFNERLKTAKEKGEVAIGEHILEEVEPMPYIVIVVDELADLMMVAGKKIEMLIARITQKARAAGIHLILATQRPSVDVITGLIKANVPSRIAFKVASKIDSRTILDQMGAQTLLGMGDMLFLNSSSPELQRLHGAFVSDDEVHKTIAYLKKYGGEAKYLDEILQDDIAQEMASGGSGADAESDPFYDQAVAIVIEHKRPSISFVQRKLGIGYNRAAKILEQMENAGIVSAMGKNGTRQIRVPNNNE